MKNKVYPLHEVTPSRLREVAVLHNAQKPTQRVKENEEMGICSQQKNEIKPQEKS